MTPNEIPELETFLGHVLGFMVPIITIVMAMHILRRLLGVYDYSDYTLFDWFMDLDWDTILPWRRKKHQAEVAEAEAKAKEQTRKKSLEQQSRAAIKKMRDINNAIPDKKITEQINDMEQTTATILDSLQKFPDRLPIASKFLNFYLPTSVQLLETYQRLYEIQNPGPNISQSKRKIQDALDDMIKTFHSQLDDLFADDVLDVDTSITVFKQMMARDGIDALRPIDTATKTQPGDGSQLPVA